MIKHQWRIMVILFIFSPLAAWATLGQDENSITADATALNAKVLVRTQSNYKLYDLILSNQDIQIHEYFDPNSDTVFAITWQGKHIPNIHQLLGEYFTKLNNIAKNKQGAQRRAMTTQQNQIYSTFSGTIENYYGKVVLTQKMPIDSTLESIQ